MADTGAGSGPAMNGERLAFLGLGVMGGPMAGHLGRDRTITVFNRTLSKAEAWVAQNGH